MSKQSRQLANAERIADEAIQKLCFMAAEFGLKLQELGLTKELEPNAWQSIEIAASDAAAMRKELES